MIKGCALVGTFYGIIQLILCIDYLISLTLFDVCITGLCFISVYTILGALIGLIINIIKKLI